jgi:hypothetical protein
MLTLMLMRQLAPRAFQLINTLGITAIVLGLFAIASGLIDHSRIQTTAHIERVKETR